MYDKPGPCCQTQGSAPPRQLLVKSAVLKLERTVEELTGLVSGISTTFGPVIYSQATCDRVEKERSKMEGSDLGQNLMSLADRLDGLNDTLKTLIEQADL
jgi:hypothetical protein